jgi:transcription elongation factor GreA
MNNKYRQSVLGKISTLKVQINDASSQIEKERAEMSEENSVLQELTDKKEILIQQLEELQASIIGDNNQALEKTYIIETKGRKRELTIVMPTEADPSAGLISMDSPLAKALEGKRAGEIVKVPTPDGHVDYKVNKIK